MNKIPLNAVVQVVEIAMRDPKIKRTTKIISPRVIVRCTRRHPRASEFVLKIGSPNYLERDFIKLCTKAGEPYPIKKVQIKFYPKKNPARKTRAGR